MTVKTSKKKAKSRAKSKVFKKKSLRFIFLIVILLGLILMWIPIPRDKMVQSIINKKFPQISKLLHFENARVSLSGTVRVQNVRFSLPLQKGHLKIRIPELSVNIRRLPLLRGKILLDHIDADSIFIQAKQKALVPILYGLIQKSKDWTVLKKELSSLILVSLNNDVFKLTSPTDTLQIEQVQFSMHPKSLSKIGAYFSCDHIFYNRSTLVSKMEAEGSLQKEEYNFSFHSKHPQNAKASGTFKIQPRYLNNALGEIHFSRFSLEAFRSIIPIPPKPAIISGLLNGQFQLQGIPRKLSHLKGSASLNLQSVHLKNLPFQQGDFVQSYAPVFADLAFNSIEIPQIKIYANKIHINQLHAFSDLVEISGSGKADFDFHFNFALMGILSQTGMKKLPSLTRKAMKHEADGKGSFKMSLSGTPKKQKITLNQSVMKNLVNNQLRELGNGIMGIFGK